MAALVQERDELSAHTKDAENAAQGRIHKLEEELSRLSSEHLRSGSMVHWSLQPLCRRYTHTIFHRLRKTGQSL